MVPEAQAAGLPLVALALGWQPGQLPLFQAELLERLLRGGRPCAAPD